MPLKSSCTCTSDIKILPQWFIKSSKGINSHSETSARTPLYCNLLKSLIAYWVMIEAAASFKYMSMAYCIPPSYFLRVVLLTFNENDWARLVVILLDHLLHFERKERRLLAEIFLYSKSKKHPQSYAIHKNIFPPISMELVVAVLHMDFHAYYFGRPHTYYLSLNFLFYTFSTETLPKIVVGVQKKHALLMAPCDFLLEPWNLLYSLLHKRILPLYSKGSFCRLHYLSICSSSCHSSIIDTTYYPWHTMSEYLSSSSL